MRNARVLQALAVLAVAAGTLAGASSKNPKSAETSLDRYIEDAMRRGGGPTPASPSSLWSPSSRLTDMAADLRARSVDDVVTILVAERASAVSSGVTKNSRKSNANATVGALAGITRTTGPWSNLANASAATDLAGEGATSRDSSVSTTLSARITHVLPNGYLVVEGNKEIQVNSERQTVTVRGVVRPSDLTTNNTVSSNQIAQLEVKISGRGGVGDAIRRPFILYRLLLGLLPF